MTRKRQIKGSDTYNQRNVCVDMYVCICSWQLRYCVCVCIRLNRIDGICTENINLKNIHTYIHTYVDIM